MTSVHRSAAIEKLELRLFDFLREHLSARDAMIASIGYFDKCTNGVLKALIDMPRPYWRQEARDALERWLCLTIGDAEDLV